MPLNFMYRACGDGPMFDAHHEALEWIETNIAGGTTWVETLAWCSDCSEWVSENAQRHCPECGAPWYDEEGVCGFRGGKGKEAWQALQEQREREMRDLAAWNSGKPIPTRRIGY